MGKQAIQVDKIELENCISSLESSRTFNNRGELWKAVQETEFAKNCHPRPLTSQVAMLLSEKFHIQLKTPKGKKGRSIGSGMPLNIHKKRRSRELSEEQIKNLINIIPKDKRESCEGLINKVAKGSVKALIQLKCLDCSNWQREEVRGCRVTNCPLHVVRPYK